VAVCLALAGAEGAPCEGQRFHSLPNLVEKFRHAGHAGKMVPVTKN